MRVGVDQVYCTVPGTVSEKEEALMKRRNSCTALWELFLTQCQVARGCRDLLKVMKPDFVCHDVVSI
jgi:hypothetical protein